MIFKIPFTFSNIDTLKAKSNFITHYVQYQKSSKMRTFLENCDVNITREEYIAVCLRTTFIFFIIQFIFFSTLLALFSVSLFVLFGIILAMMFSSIIFIGMVNYPKMYVQKRQKDIERNLISALQDMLVQLDSGIPLFGVMVNISSADYGELSNEFKKAVRKISAGQPEQDVLEELSKSNPSSYFRRTLWQISNGMNAGADMTVVLKDNIKALTEEQMIQIQNYGNRLNPLIVFYMLVAIIIPSLSITFLTIISSMVGLSKETSTSLFIGLFIGVILIQIVFLGIIKTKRPTLM